MTRTRINVTAMAYIQHAIAHNSIPQSMLGINEGEEPNLSDEP